MLNMLLNMLARNLRSAAFVAAPAITILNVHASPTLCVGKHDACTLHYSNSAMATRWLMSANLQQTSGRMLATMLSRVCT